MTFTELLTIFNPSIQGILAVVGLWYTIETRKLRLQSENQSKTAIRQKRLSIAPYLVVGVMHPESFIDEDEDNEDKRKEFIAKLEESRKNDEFLYLATISNPTEKIAIQTNVYIFDNNKKSYLTGDIGHQVISAKDNEAMPVSKPYMTEEEVRKVINKDYDLSNEFNMALKAIEKDSSVIYLLYKDIEGYPYLVVRPFDIDDDGDFTFSNQLFYFNGN